MSTALIIATREIRERSRLFIVAAALAAIPFLVHLAPGSRANHDAAIRAIGSGAAVIYALALALVMGVSTIGRDLFEKRLSFYFSKPVSPAALWIGKAGASLGIALVSAVIVALPSVLASPPLRDSSWEPSMATIALFALIASSALFLGGHAVSTMTRSRSALVLLDFVSAAATVAIVAWILRPIVVAGGAKVAGVLGTVLFGGLLLVLALAPVWQLDRGRSDVRRSHAALSQFLWTGVGVLLLIVGSVAIWLRAVDPEDLVETRHIDQAPVGGWAVVTGVPAHRGDLHSSFLMNSKTGETSRLAIPPWSSVAWSRDGRVAAWWQPVGFVRIQEFELHRWDATSGKILPTGITAPAWSGVALSDDGVRVAIAKSDTLAVYDLQNQRHLASVKIENGSRAELFFASRDRVRLIQHEHNRRQDLDTARCYELDVPSRALAKTGERMIPGGYRLISFSSDGDRAFVRTTGEIVDGRTLAPIAKLAPNASWGSAMLNDGNVAIVEKDPAGVRLRIFDRDGRPLHVIAMPNVQRAYLLAETTDGKLLLNGGSPGAGNMFVVDRKRGVVDRTVSGVAGPMPGWRVDPRVPRFEAGVPFFGSGAESKVTTWRVAA